MKKSKLFRTLTLAVAAALCKATTTVTAYAGGADPDPVPLPETTEAPAEVPEETEEPTTGGMEPEGVPVTPQGNAALVDDFFGDKQLITVTTKAGNYFYILIDRANEDKETAVHFLNQVDDADLQALLEDGKKEPEVCNCTAKCQAGAVNTACPVCKNNLTACNGPEPKPQPEEEKPQEEKPSGMGCLLYTSSVFLCTPDDVYICDPEAEYYPLVNRLHGQVVKLSPTSKNYVNPLDINLNYSEDENPLALKSDFVLRCV